ncbi:MAG: DegV family protein [Clostridia bacterium]|nr:DegV family protein [Clostridia bacterium]
MEKRFAIVVDGACDLTEEQCRERDILFVPSHVSLPDGRDVIWKNKWDVMSKEAFYDALKKDPASFTTAPANAEEFGEVLEPLVKEGRDILCFSISSSISGTFSFINQAINELQDKHGQVNIRPVDSLRFSIAEGMLALRAADLRDQGMTMEETYEEVEKVKNTLHQAGWLDDLSFVAKKGRLSHSKAFFGSMVGIKPIGEFDYNGLTTVIGKAKGQKRAFTALVAYIEKTGIDLQNQDIFIAQTNRMPQAEAYRDLLQDHFHPRSIRIVDVFPACGVNIGPGLMAAYYYGTPISKGLEKERAILNETLEKDN